MREQAGNIFWVKKSRWSLHVALIPPFKAEKEDESMMSLEQTKSLKSVQAMFLLSTPSLPAFSVLAIQAYVVP